MTSLTLSSNTFPLQADVLGLSAGAREDGEVGSHPARVEQRFLRCPLLGWDATLIPLESVLEVFPLPLEAILSIPDMPDCVMGTLNRRGEFLWLVDLQARLGAPPLSASGFSQNRLGQGWMGISMSTMGRSLAVGVPEIGDIEAHSADQIQAVPPGLFSAELQPFVAGYLMDEVGATGVILSPEALLTHPVN
ncbi:MAG: chemotaxis protein CheW [Cyanophyceae cyanobacterium]